jgi:hypothetical protein
MTANDPPLNDQVKSLSLVFKRNLGNFLSRVQQQANLENGTTDIEGLLTDLDRVISNQKQLSELIQKGKNIYWRLFCLKPWYISKITSKNK